MQIANNIRRLREVYQLSQKDLALIAGVSDKAVSSWERGEREPRMGAIQKIADHFGITKSQLIEGDDVTPQPQPTRDWLRQLCAGNKKALAALDRLSITENGEIKLDGGDVVSQAILQHQIRTLISALEAATDNGDGTKTAIWNPNI